MEGSAKYDAVLLAAGGMSLLVVGGVLLSYGTPGRRGIDVDRSPTLDRRSLVDDG